MKRRRLQMAAAGLVCLLAVVALSNPGRVALRRLAAKVTGSPASKTAVEASEATADDGPDVEQRARARHGWGTPIINSVVQGTITYYDRNGGVSDQAGLTVYRALPNSLRVELNRNGTVETVGFNGISAWQAGTTTLSAPRARDIRAWLRAWPDRLFTSRGGGAPYREPGTRLESSRPARPWQGATHLRQPIAYDQVEMQDVLVPPVGGGAGDQRTVLYYVNQQTATVEAARWLEPDDPTRAVNDATAPKQDVRVDFGDFRQVGAVLWPYEIVHWQGGKVDYRITVTQVQLNQSLVGTIFQAP